MKRQSTVRPALATLAAAIVLGAGATAHGEPLQPEACETLKAEQARLEGLGVGQDLRRGPPVVLGGLSPTRLKEVERLITVIEQIEFRCPRPPPPPAEASAGAPTKSAAGATGEDQPRKPKSRSKPAAKPDGGSASAAGAAAPVASKPATKKKPSDAYVPPDDDQPATKPEPPRAVAKSPPAAAPPAKPGLAQ